MEDYKKSLNDKQLQAVEAIDGPVLVIAGAGTGKTQTIAVRIANILAKTDTQPQSILCLTFTDSAATNMRSRLIKIIGPDAYKVRIHTFHSFCNEIIQSHSEDFVFGKSIALLDDLERIEILQSLIDKLPDGAILKPWGDKYLYQKELVSVIQTLKREDITSDKLLELINQEKEFVDQTEKLFIKIKEDKKQILNIFTEIFSHATGPILDFLDYQKKLFDNGGFVVGAAKNPDINFKNALLKFFLDLQKNVPKQFELQKIYTQYQKKLIDCGRYDYDDMILMVLDKFKQDQNLLLEYQEKYQYLLVDEYQDTNTAQNEIINLLANYYDNPNLFVVGDDDQSIFRFQGANLENIYDFVKRFKPLVITLKNNYRSHQTILDSADSVISKNINRITKYLDNIDKSLVSKVDFDKKPINLFASTSVLDENYFVADTIKKLIKNNIKPSEIAVLFRNKTDVNNLLPVLDNLNIKYNLSFGNNILDDVKINQLITLLKFIENPTTDENLFQILSFDFLKINSFDLYNYFRHQKENKKIQKFLKKIARSHKILQNYNLDNFFNKIIRKFGILKKIIKDRDYESLQKFNTFYHELKTLSFEKNISLAEFLHRLDVYKENNIAIETEDTINADNKINLFTVHKAKGLEFEHVFIMNLTDNRWGGGYQRTKIKLPYGILKYEISKSVGDSSEDDRRLFYVALTRAKKEVYLSYSSEIPSQFIAEIKPELINTISPDKDFSAAALLSVFVADKSIITDTKLEDHIKNYLTTKYQLSVTHLNSYLRCPLCFYYKSILRIPQAKNKYSSYGTAIHSTLNDFYHAEISLKNLLENFKNYLSKENLNKADFKESLSKGILELSAYYEKYHDTIKFSSLLEYDFRKFDTHLDEVPITGKIDKIDILKNDQVEVVDFKTGNPDNAANAPDYLRQILFYKLLGDNTPEFRYKIESGLLDYLQKCKQKSIIIKDEDLENLKIQIKDVYNKILRLDFNHIGEQCKDENHLHQFQKI